MLFQVRMTVKLPPDMPVEQANRLTLYKVLGGGWRESTVEAAAGSGATAAPRASGG